MSGEQFASVWDAIEDTPATAEVMRVRGKVDLFEVEALVGMAVRVGLGVGVGGEEGS